MGKGLELMNQAASWVADKTNPEPAASPSPSKFTPDVKKKARADVQNTFKTDDDMDYNKKIKGWLGIKE